MRNIPLPSIPQKEFLPNLPTERALLNTEAMTEIVNPTTEDDNWRNFAARKIIDIPYVADNKSSIVFDTHPPQEKFDSDEDYGYEYYDDEEEPEVDNVEDVRNRAEESAGNLRQ